MITFVKGISNRLRLEVESSVDISGFSAVVAVCPTIKTIEDLTAKNLAFTFESGDFPFVTSKPMQGTLLVLDGEGNTYLRFLLDFEVVEKATYDTSRWEQVLYLTVVSTKGTSGGATPSGDYVTKGELHSAVEECEHYTDEQIADIGETIIETQPIHVVDPEGQPMDITVQQAAQQLVQMQADIEEGKTTHTVAHVEDADHDGQPDGGVLYLNPSKPH